MATSEPDISRDKRRTVPQIASRQQALESARGLADRIRSRAAKAEQNRCVPPETISELTDRGLFGVVTPASLGGSELGFATLFDVTIELASACASTGWVYGVLAGHSWLVNLFPEQAQADVFSDPTRLIATIFRLAGTVTEVDGGYRLVDGEGRFASGIDHASWIIVGNAVQHTDGTAEPHFFIVPTSEIEIIDDWYAAGMRATGSKTIKIRESIIPKHRAVRVSDMMSGTAPGSKAHTAGLYRLPFFHVAPFSIVGAPLGGAVGAIDEFASRFSTLMEGADDVAQSDAGFRLARLAQSSAEVDSAITLVRASAEMIDSINDPDVLSQLDQTKILRNWAYAVQTCREATNRLFESAGAQQIYETSTLQRIWRDVNSAAQHYAFGWENAMKNHGRAMIGLAPHKIRIKRR